MRALLLLALLLAGCASPAPEAASIVFPDVHGVAVDPTDASRVLVATHHGLFRGDGSSWAHVGETRNDMMGFAVAPSGALYASGHPPGGGNIGLQRSDDGGVTWTRVGAEGFDFHALTVSPADPQRMYGYYRGEVWRSDDAGASWTAQAKLATSSLAAHPARADTVLAATTASVGRSDNGGIIWAPMDDQKAYGVAVGADGRVVIAGKDFVRASDDLGESWTDVTPPGADGTFSALSLQDDIIVAASYEGAVWRSDDAGATWRQIH